MVAIRCILEIEAHIILEEKDEKETMRTLNITTSSVRLLISDEINQSITSFPMEW